MVKDHFVLAVKGLKNRGIRSWLTVLGIFIGIAAVTSLVSLGEGLREAVTGQFASLGTDKLIIQSAEAGFGPPGSTAAKPLTKEDLEAIEEIHGVDEAIIRYIRVVRVDFDRKTDFIFVTSVPENEKEIEILSESLQLETEKGMFLTTEDRKKIVIGEHIDKDHFDGELVPGEDLEIQDEDFEIIGILKMAGNFQLNNVIFMPEEDLKEILMIGNEIDLIVVQVKNGEDIEKTADKLYKKLRSTRNVEEGEEDFSVRTPLESVAAVNNILNIINLIFFGVATISLIVGGVGIANTMYISMLERKKEIGIMKAIGAKNSDVLKIFILEAGLLGLVGGILGALGGLGLAYLASLLISINLSALSLKVTISYPLLFAAVLFSFLVGTFAGLLPALRASKLNPSEALRK